jgi:(1->4)-alpha-D-glucan 1-alpha-D-glucosylmutase
MQRCLAERVAVPDLFTDAHYLPLRPAGPRARHVVAFARTSGDQWAIAVVPRFVSGLDPMTARFASHWSETTVRLPREAPNRWRSAFGTSIAARRGSLALEELFASMPVALLRSPDGG